MLFAEVSVNTYMTHWDKLEREFAGKGKNLPDRKLCGRTAAVTHAPFQLRKKVQEQAFALLLNLYNMRTVSPVRRPSRQLNPAFCRL